MKIQGIKSSSFLYVYEDTTHYLLPVLRDIPTGLPPGRNLPAEPVPPYISHHVSTACWCNTPNYGLVVRRRTSQALKRVRTRDQTATFFQPWKRWSAFRGNANSPTPHLSWPPPAQPLRRFLYPIMMQIWRSPDQCQIGTSWLGLPRWSQTLPLGRGYLFPAWFSCYNRHTSALGQIFSPLPVLTWFNHSLFNLQRTSEALTCKPLHPTWSRFINIISILRDEESEVEFS